MRLECPPCREPRNETAHVCAECQREAMQLARDVVMPALRHANKTLGNDVCKAVPDARDGLMTQRGDRTERVTSSRLPTTAAGAGPGEPASILGPRTCPQGPLPTVVEELSGSLGVVAGHGDSASAGPARTVCVPCSGTTVPAVVSADSGRPALSDTVPAPDGSAEMAPATVSVATLYRAIRSPGLVIA